MRGHATYVDSEILDVIKIDFWTSHERCVNNLSTRSYQDPTKNRGYHGPGGSRRYQVSVNISNKIETD